MRQAELVRVNADVNKTVRPTRKHENVTIEKWLISPKFGDCSYYVVTKRHELLALGLHSRDLLLAEVETSWGEYHLVLAVRTAKGDLVPDSRSKKNLNWVKTLCDRVGVQTSAKLKLWLTI